MLLNQSSPPLVRTIGNLIAEKLLVEVHSPEDDLLATGVLDSHSLIELLLNLEQHFGMKIPLDELQIEDVRSVRSIANMVESKRSMQSQALEVGSASGARWWHDFALWRPRWPPKDEAT